MIGYASTITTVCSSIRLDENEHPNVFLILFHTLQQHVVCKTNGLHHLDRLIVPLDFREYFAQALLPGNIHISQFIQQRMGMLIYPSAELRCEDQQLILLEAARYPMFADNLEFALQCAAYPLAAIVVQLGHATAPFPFIPLPN